MKAFVGAVVLTLVVGFAQQAQAVNLVANGDFGTGDFTGWTQSGNAGFTFVDGSNVANLGPFGSDGSLTQGISTAAGHSYTFSFTLANTVSASLGSPNDFSASAGAFSPLTLTNSSAFSTSLYSFVFTATGPTTTIGFAFRNDSGFWKLDDVSVTANATTTPIPPALLLFVTTLGGLGVVGYRRRGATTG